MSFETHVTTIAIGSLSFGLKNHWVFWAVEFFQAWVFSKTLKKACATYALEPALGQALSDTQNKPSPPVAGFLALGCANVYVKTEKLHRTNF